MFGIKRLARQVEQLQKDNEQLGIKVNELQNQHWSGPTPDIIDPLLGITSPVRYPHNLTAPEIIARFDELYEHLAVERKTNLPPRTILQKRFTAIQTL